MVSVHCNFEQTKQYGYRVRTPNIQNGIHFEAFMRAAGFRKEQNRDECEFFREGLETRHRRILQMRKRVCSFPPFMNHNLHDDLHDELLKKNFVGNRTGRGDSQFLQIGGIGPSP
ncbi:hypothetical protein KP509_11G087700 [Ceratopteris richardii]|uniref:Uncharacterized protein n=1 Tax=Ceratopteris richardii TaxID=49495 RepID=A0A8T2TV70_CERRI|nr:hypothetical protein KP509_11G087700 [Ceratopteris richardii]